MFIVMNDMLAQLESPVRKPPREREIGMPLDGLKDRRVLIEYMWGPMQCTTEVLLRRVKPFQEIIFEYVPPEMGISSNKLHVMPFTSQSMAIESIRDMEHRHMLYENTFARVFFSQGTIDATNLRILRIARFGSEIAADLLRKDNLNTGSYRWQTQAYDTARA
jgi:hypothetical protein